MSDFMVVFGAHFTMQVSVESLGEHEVMEKPST